MSDAPIVPEELKKSVETEVLPPENQPLWGKWPQETSEEYSKFLVFRNLGPNRTLKIAYQKSIGKQGVAISGKFGAMASRFKWAIRATDWDANNEIKAGEAVTDLVKRQTVASQELLTLVAEKSLELFKMETIDELKKAIPLLAPKIDLLMGRGNVAKTVIDAYRVVINDPQKNMKETIQKIPQLSFGGE